MKVCTTMLNTPLSKILRSMATVEETVGNIPEITVPYLLHSGHQLRVDHFVSLRFGNGIVIVTMKWEAY